MMRADPNRWLKLKTRQLIAACGGLDEASRACAEGCRPYSIPHLSRCQVAGTAKGSARTQKVVPSTS